ncbi:MAG: DUF4339 domain-containing protein [Planctomycetota bacterium]
MEQRLYVRLRGRVQGPFQRDRLRELVRRGQLSSIHQVSVDSIEWQPASDFPELFPEDPVQTPQAAASTAAATVAQADPNATPAAAADEAWHYAIGNQQHGPVSLGELRGLARSAVIGPQDLVWTESMGEWAAAGATPRVADAFGAAARATGNGRQSVHADSLSDPAGNDVARTLADSRGWIACIAVGLFLVGVVLLVSGGGAVMVGVKYSQPLVMAGGFNVSVLALVFLCAGQLVLNANSRIGRYLRQPDTPRLDAFLRSLRTLWVFAAVVMIVVFVNSLAIAVWAASAGIAFLPPPGGP